MNKNRNFSRKANNSSAREENLLRFNAPRNTELDNNLASLFPKPFDAALFLDNDIGHIKNVDSCGPKVFVRKVPGSEGYVSQPIFPRYVNGTLTPYWKHLGALSPKGVGAAEVFQKLIIWNGNKELEKMVEHLDPGSGVGQKDVAYIEKWVNDREGQKLAVLFDYDRTITVIEGGYFLSYSFETLKFYLSQLSLPEQLDLKNDLTNFTLEGFVEYYVGGEERLKMLQEMFDFLYTKNVTVYLLTNNTGCPKSKQLFQDVMGVLTRDRPITIICGAEFGFNKKVAIQRQSNLSPGAALKSLCLPRGGRKKKTKRSKKHK